MCSTYITVRSAQKISGAISTQTGPKQHEQHDNAGAPSGTGKRSQLQTVLSRTILGSRGKAAGSLQSGIHLRKQTHTHSELVNKALLSEITDSKHLLSRCMRIQCQQKWTHQAKLNPSHTTAYLQLTASTPWQITPQRHIQEGKEQLLRKFPVFFSYCNRFSNSHSSHLHFYAKWNLQITLEICRFLTRQY